MPQFDPTTMSPQVIWLVITFGFFYLLMARLALPKIGNVLEERGDRIADDLDQAEQLRREGLKVQDDFQGGLTDARSEALRILNEARAAAQTEMDAKSRALDAQLNAQAEDAEQRIRAEKQKAMTELEGVAAEVAENIVKKLLGDSLAKGDIEAAVKAEITARGKA